MNPTHCVSRFTITVSILAFLCIAGIAHGQLNTPMEDTWVANGPVFATESDADALYLGGNFSYVGPGTGSAVRLQDDDLLAAAPAFPKVNGTVYAMTSDGAGGWYIGGSFTRVGSKLRNRIARILFDGTVDPAWNPDVNNTVYALAVSSDGNTVYTGGDFTRIGSITRRYLASIDATPLSPTYGDATVWDPSPDAFVRTMLLSSDGALLYVGGNFTGYAKAYDVSGLPLVEAWTSTLDGMVHTMALSPDGTKLFMGGWFANHVTVLDPATGIADGGWSALVNNPVMSIAATDTTVYIGGTFTTVNFLERNGIAALGAANGATLEDWIPDANGWVTALAISPDDITVYAGGEFTEIGGESRHHIARLDAVAEGDTTGRATIWDAGAGNSVHVLKPVIETTVEYLYAGGAFTTVNGVVRNNLASFGAMTGIATNWDPNANNVVYAMAMNSPGDTLYVGGMFDEIDALPAVGFAAVDPAGTGALLWTLNADDTVRTLTLTPDNLTIYAGGDFTLLDGSPRNYIAAVDTGTQTLRAWTANADAPVDALAATDTIVYAGGEFRNISGQPRDYLAALDGVTGNVTGWMITADAPVLALKLTGTFGVLYAGGNFTTIGGQPRSRLAALDTIDPGAVLPWTDLGLNGAVECILLDEGMETLWIGGNFVNNPPLRLAAVDLNPLFFGDLMLWDPRMDNPVYTLDQSVAGTSIYAGGTFNTVSSSTFSGGGDSRSYIANFVLRPVITLLGSDPETLECGNAYIESGYTAFDAAGNDITASVIVGGDIVDSNTVGTYNITYNVTDGAGNPALEVTRTVNVVDTTIPVITLLGVTPVTVECGNTYTDAGATAADTCDGDLTLAIVIVDPVDTLLVGVYTITYDVSDGVSNAAVQVTRTVNVVDTTIPAITMLGVTPVTVECGGTYTDAGATAADACDGDLTAAIVLVNPVNTSTIGSYTVTYDVTDGAGNIAAQVTRTVNVVDTTVPVITLLGNNPETADCGIAYVDAGATAVDICEGDLTAAIAIVNPVNTAIIGTYTVTYDVSDITANAAMQVTRTVNITDTIAPVITMLGSDPVTVECKAAYFDAGATANDACDGDLTLAIVTVDPVDTNIVGVYTVTYDVSDSASNAAIQDTRTVNVTDTTLPVITMLGATPVIVECGNAYADAGATAADTCDGDLTAALVTVDPVNTSLVGSYTVTYDVTDGSSNAAAQVTRTVTIQDTTIPVITMLGITPETVECGSVYADAGATASDACDGDLTAAIVLVNPVNTGTVGSYTVTYNVTDGAGNAAAQITRTVTVVDTTAPIITLLGNNPETADCGIAYGDAGATAADACEGDLTATIVTVDPVDTAVIGTYTVTYDVSDGATHAAAQVTRTVNVTDTLAPVITLLGSDPVTVECKAAYFDAGATANDACDGDLTLAIVTVDPVDTNIVGVYTVTYDVSDSASNAAIQGTRTVNVTDTILPVITMLGATPVTVECGNAYADAGATADDTCDGDLTAAIAVVNPVDINTVGTYTVTYDVSDSSSNSAAQVTRTVTIQDTIIPTITLIGNDPETAECNTAYADAGATASDACDGDLTAAIATVNPVNTGTLGSYTVTYDVNDGATHAAVQVTRTVNVTDTIIPVIAMLGVTPVTVECGGTYTDAGATASDSCEGDLTASLVLVNPVNTGTAGSYTVTYDVSDSTGNAATQVTRIVNVVDTTIPVLTLLGSAVVTSDKDVAYIDAGAAAADICDGDLTAVIVTVNPVNIAVVATYTVTYDVSDSASNAAVQIDRIVHVVDPTLPYVDQVQVIDANTIRVIFSKNMGVSAETAANYTLSGSGQGSFAAIPDTVVEIDPATYELNWNCPAIMLDAGDITITVAGAVTDDSANPMTTPFAHTHVGGAVAGIPVITLIGSSPTTADCGVLYVDAGATAADACATDLTASIATVNPVNDMVLGSYTITYNLSDGAGNIATEIMRIVNVVDVTAPVITLLGSSPATTECKAAYVDAGATAIDACEGDLTATIVTVDPVNTNIVGVYTVTYDVSDSASNAAIQGTRTVNVTDTTVPVITMLGVTPVTVECGNAYADAGAAAADGCDGDLTASIVTVNPVDTNVASVYTVTYDVSDSASNTAVQITRTVNVEDTGTPIITLTGNAIETVECGNVYADAGATATDTCAGDLTASIITVNPVDTNIAGVYIVIYDVSDLVGNPALQVTRTVNVEDTGTPIITLTGNAVETVECGGVYADAGATAADGCNGDLTASIVTGNPVDTNIIGVYTVTYDVDDLSGNPAVQVTRTVNVEDTQPPVLTIGTNWPFVPIYEDGFMVHACNTPFVEPPDLGAVDACIGPLPLPVFPNLAVGVPGIYAFAWKLDLAKNPIWAGVPPPPGGLPDIRPYDDFFNAPAGDYLLVYITQDASGNTYPALDANGIPPIFDAMWAPIFLDGFGNLLPGIDFARLIRVNGCAKLIPSAFDIAFELQEYFAIYDTDSDGTLNATELLVAYVGLHNTYPDLDQDEFNAVVAQLSNGTGTLTEEQVNTFVDAHDGTCTPDTTPPAVLFQDITVELNADGQASLFTETALYGTAAITYLYDNCLGDGKDHLDAFTTTATPDTFTCDDIGKVQVTLTVSDGANKTTGTVTVTVEEGAATCSGCRGCMPGCNKGLSVEGYRKKLADWLLIGLTLTCMFAFSTTRRK